MCSQENAPLSPSPSRRDRMACPVNCRPSGTQSRCGEILRCYYYKHAIPPGFKRKNLIFQTASLST